MRRLVILFILAGAALMATGCKSGDTAQPAAKTEAGTDNAPAGAQPNTTASSAIDTRPLIVCFGDSLTAGYGTDPGESYPDFLQADLDGQGYKYRVVNAGVSGNTTKDGINRLDSVIAMKAAIVIVEFGGNDGLRGVLCRGLSREPGHDSGEVEG